MFNTVILKNQTSDYKVFDRLTVKNLEQKITSVPKVLPVFKTFYFSDGSVELLEKNFIYILEHIPHNRDIILPKNPNYLDWIMLAHDQDNTIFKLTIDKSDNIIIRGNGNRIMGYDEHLMCDIDFLSIKLVFLGSTEGWVLV